MKTAISIPDDVFEAAERAASRLGISRSQFYSTAVREFIERAQRSDVTARLDQIYSDDCDSELDPVLRSLQSASLEGEAW